MIRSHVDTLSMIGTAATAGASVVTAATPGTFPMSLLLWCLCGSFAGVAIAGPTKVREALAKIEGRTAVIVEVLALGIGGLASLTATSLLGFGVIGAISLGGNYQIPFFGWAAKINPADLWPLGILISATLQVGAQKLLGAVVDVGVSFLHAFQRSRGSDKE